MNQPAPGYPPYAGYTPPPKGKGKAWLAWVIGFVGALIVGLVLVVWLADDPGESGGGTGGVTAKGGATAKGGPTVKLVSTGTLDGRAESYVAWGSYLATGSGWTATLWQFDQNGVATKVNSVGDVTAGELLDVVVGDFRNDGHPAMLALYEDKLYVVDTTGSPQVIENDGIVRILIGDYDGDGKQETIFLTESPSGKHGFEVYRYGQSSSGSNMLYSAEKNNPQPLLLMTQLRRDNRDLLVGYRWDPDLTAVLYKWDGIGGATEIGSFPIADSDSAHWLAIGGTRLGSTMMIARDGAEPHVEVFGINQGATTATSLGTFSDGQGWTAVTIGALTGKSEQALLVDQFGSYFLYDLIPGK